MTNVDLFSTPIKSKKVRDGVYAHMYSNGVINIDGMKFLCYSMTDAIKLWKKQNKRI